jgi:hypothetical protein
MAQWDQEIQNKWHESLAATSAVAAAAAAAAAKTPAKKVTDHEVDGLSKRLQAMSFLDQSSNDNRNYVSLFLAKACALWTFKVRNQPHPHS